MKMVSIDAVNMRNSIAPAIALTNPRLGAVVGSGVKNVTAPTVVLNWLIASHVANTLYEVGKS